MQVENAAHTAFLTTPAGGGVSLEAGRQVVARVLEVGLDGGARISLAGQQVTVQSDLSLKPGQTLHLTVGDVSNGQVRLQVMTSGQPGTSTSGGFPDTSAQLAQYAPNAIRELARAGVPVTPQLAQAVARAVEQLASMPGGPNAETAAKAVANLVARDFALSPAAAGRVAAALELAGRLGSELNNLATRSSLVANSLSTAPAGTVALRTALAPTLTPAELAVARVVQASEAARAALTSSSGFAPAAAAPSSASPQIVTNYVLSQVAVGTRLDDAARAATSVPTPASPAPAATPGQLQAQTAAVRGDAAAELIATARGQASASGAGAPSTSAPPVQQPPAGAATQNAAQAQAAGARSQANAASATTQATAATPPQVANVVANLSVAVARFAQALAPAEGAPGALASVQGRAMSALEGHAPGGSYTPQALGGGPAGAPAPLIASLRQASGEGAATGQQNPGQQLLATLGRYDASQIAAGLTQVPEQRALAIAGMLIAALGEGAASMSGEAQAQVRAFVQRALHELGVAMTAHAHDDHNALRAALEQVAANDPRASVQEQAARLLNAMDGQQLLSQPRAGADPGYVYFQLPLPEGKNAEVLVRREPGRRTITFDTFDIAFLLDTESLGSLMIHLEAHPGAVRAMVKTDQPHMEQLIRAQAEQLKAIVQEQAARPVTVSTGVFASGAAPATLLEPEFGFVPGENVYYA